MFLYEFMQSGVTGQIFSRYFALCFIKYIAAHYYFKKTLIRYV